MKCSPPSERTGCRMPTFRAPLGSPFPPGCCAANTVMPATLEDPASRTSNTPCQGANREPHDPPHGEMQPLALKLIRACPPRAKRAGPSGAPPDPLGIQQQWTPFSKAVKDRQATLRHRHIPMGAGRGKCPADPAETQTVDSHAASSDKTVLARRHSPLRSRLFRRFSQYPVRVSGRVHGSNPARPHPLAPVRRATGSRHVPNPEAESRRTGT